MQPKKRRCCVIVAGMHRSGTSALTRVINLLGADISTKLLPAKADNDRGFWEPTNIVNIHDRLLVELGSAWHDPMPLREGWLASSAAQRAKRSLADEINRDFHSSEVFVVKDPRVPRFLPLWLELLDEMEVEPVIVITVRNPLEVASSLETRDGFKLGKSLLLYIQSNLDAEVFSRGRTRCFVSYEELLENWQPFAATIVEITGIVPPSSAAGQINEYLTAQLRHSRFSRADLASRSDVAGLVVDIFDCMQGAVARTCTDIHGSFDRFRKSFSEGLSLFGSLIQSERQAAVGQLARSKEERAHIESTLKAEIASLQTELELVLERGLATENAKQDLDASQQKSNMLEIKIEQLASDNQLLSRKVAELEKTLRGTVEDYSKAKLQVLRIESVLAERSVEVDQLNRTLEDRACKIQELEARLDLQRFEIIEFEESVLSRLEANLTRFRNRRHSGPD